MQTWNLLAPEISEVSDVRFLKSLYLAPPSRLLAAIQRAPQGVGRLMLIGHNPGIENLAQLLIGGGKKKARKRVLEKFPTAALAVILFRSDTWGEIAEHTGELTAFIRPKDLV